MKIELLKPHTHAGEMLEPSAVIDVDESSARWLIEIGVAREAQTEPAADTKKPTRKGD